MANLYTKVVLLCCICWFVSAFQYPVTVLNLVEVSNVQRASVVAPGETIQLSVSVPRGLVPHPQHAILRSRADSTVELRALPLVGETHIEFVGEWTAPEKEMYIVHHWVLHSGSQELYALELSTAAEVTCSDGEYCNGTERYVNGRCQSEQPACEDNDPCTVDTCDETTKRCMNKANSNRPECVCFSDCEVDCEGKECGEDGCGGFCGTCEDGKGCAEGVCIVAEVDGTCTQPIPLLDATGYANFFTQTHVVEGDTSQGINTYFPSCNTLSGAQELFYEVVVPSTSAEFVGVEMTMTGFDSVLQLQEGVCGGKVIACSDDSTPPGYLGSRVKASLEPGKSYLFMADGYNLEQKGPFELQFRFHENCLPDCDGLFCGDDGCGGSCGECEGAEQCNSGSCYPNPCTPNCASDNRECGDDGCGGSCGECDVDSGSYCITDVDEDGNVFFTGQCTEPVTPCDHFNPVCSGGCNSDQFCASDCACYQLNEPLPDLVIDADILSTEIYVEIASFSNTSCAVAEGCATGTGNRALLRFSVVSINQGYADFFPPAPKTRPDIFVYGQCHRHYHFTQFSQYTLTDPTGNSITRGRKEGYCMEDSYQYLEGSKINCLPSYDCGAQGIQAGWADVYGATLDCQWVDITHLPEGGEFQLAVAVNPGRVFAEKTFDNNEVVIRIRIPKFDIHSLGEHAIEVYSSVDFDSSNTASNSPSSNTQSNTESRSNSNSSASSSSFHFNVGFLFVALLFSFIF